MAKHISTEPDYEVIYVFLMICITCQDLIVKILNLPNFSQWYFVTVRKKCFSDGEKFLKFKAEG